MLRARVATVFVPVCPAPVLARVRSVLGVSVGNRCCPALQCGVQRLHQDRRRAKGSSGRMGLASPQASSQPRVAAAGVDWKVTTSTPVGLRPLDALEALRAKGARVKVVHFVRHGEGTHNVHKDYQAAEQLDARLTDLGKEQCAQLAARTAALSDVDVLVTSPLTRCVQTAALGFATQAAAGVPFYALESVRETVNYTCDARLQGRFGHRRPISKIARDFAQVDFSHCTEDEDPIWAMYAARFGTQAEFGCHRESNDPDHIADRARSFFRWFERTPHQEALVSSHSAFMWHFFNLGHPGYAEEEGFSAEMVEDLLPVVQYSAGEREFENHMRGRWANCEMRSMVVVYDDQDQHERSD